VLPEKENNNMHGTRNKETKQNAVKTLKPSGYYMYHLP
jgi:hypothetical protein